MAGKKRSPKARPIRKKSRPLRIPKPFEVGALRKRKK